MLKYIYLGIIFFTINITNLATATDPDPVITPFTVSDFQKNGFKVSGLDSTLKDYLADKEKEDLDFGLHLVNFDGSIMRDTSQEQFIADFSRMSCNRDHESNLPECGVRLQEKSPYAHLRSSNIFDFNKYNVAQLNIAKTVARTITEPFPDNQLNVLLADPEKAKKADNQKAMANLIASKAGIMLAQNSFNSIMGKRAPDDNNNSIMETIYNESFRRLVDANWIENAKNLNTNGLLLELLQIEAFKLWLNYYKFNQNERIEALLAALVTNQINTSNKMDTQMKEGKEEAEKASKKIEENKSSFKF